MLRLKDIGEQRKLYSSVDDIPYAHDSDSEYDEHQGISKLKEKLENLIILHICEDTTWTEQHLQCGMWQLLLTFLQLVLDYG